MFLFIVIFLDRRQANLAAGMLGAQSSDHWLIGLLICLVV
jgi:hypothetical protein